MKIKLLTLEEIEENYEEMCLLTEALDPGNGIDITLKIKKYVLEGACLCFGVFVEKKLAGILSSYKREFGGEKRVHVNYFIVSEKHRKQGLGKKLIESMVEMLKKDNIEAIDLNVDTDNINARKFYEHLGFKEEKLLLNLKLKEL